ncbi:MAG: peptidoglycan DD-metalloendopeptidase family protein [Oscillospiraceae bacterium]
MRKMKQSLRIFLLLLLAVTTLTVNLTPAVAVTWADVNNLKEDAGDLSDQKAELQKKLKTLSADKSKVLEQRRTLDQQIGVLSAQIVNAEQQIANYETLIVKTEAELAEAEAKEAEQYALFCDRVRAMEENGKVSYWSVLFKSASFTDLLSRLDFVSEVMEYDQGVIESLQQLQEKIAADKANLESAQNDSVELKAGLVSQKKDLDTQRQEANKLAAAIESNAQEYREAMDDIEAEEEEIQNRIVKISRELAAKAAAANGGKPTTAALGGYIWPVSSHKINSPFGRRNLSYAAASKNHKGVDIGGVYYSSEVHAAKAGTVIVSQYSSSYGNYVVISHGGGNTTLYAHMSSRKVSEGTEVTQGQVIGITGSTGHSTGPHLHFEITENGSRVDPLKYLTNYIKGW